MRRPAASVLTSRSSASIADLAAFELRHQYVRKEVTPLLRTLETAPRCMPVRASRETDSVHPPKNQKGIPMITLSERVEFTDRCDFFCIECVAVFHDPTKISGCLFMTLGHCADEPTNSLDDIGFDARPFQKHHSKITLRVGIPRIGRGRVEFQRSRVINWYASAAFVMDTETILCFDNTCLGSTG